PEPLEGGLPQPLVRVDDPGPAGRVPLVVEHGGRDRGNLALEPALVDGGACLVLGGEPEGVEVGAGQAAVVGDPVRGLELVGQVDGPGRRSGGAGARGDVRAETDAAHRLDAAGDAGVDHAGV